MCQSVLGNRALIYMYFPEMKAILYGPEDFSLPLLRRTILTSGFMPDSRPSRPAAAKAPAKKAAKKAATKARKASKKPGGKAG